MMLTFFINSFYNMKNILNLKERGRSSVGRYHTKQQTLILEYLALKKDTAFSGRVGLARIVGGGGKSWPSHCLPCVGPLGGGGHDSQNSLWGWQPGTLPLYGGSSPPLQRRMVCLDCGRAFPLECSHLEELTRHIQSDHQFEVDTRHTVLYGHCCDCGK